jgi:hypothetical protein
MVHVEFRRPGNEAGRSKCVATLTQRGRRPAQIEGAEPKVVDLERVVLSVSTGEAIRWEDDPEEWARSLSDSDRSPHLLAEIVHDDGAERFEIDQPHGGELLAVHRRAQTGS